MSTTELIKAGFNVVLDSTAPQGPSTAHSTPRAVDGLALYKEAVGPVTLQRPPPPKPDYSNNKTLGGASKMWEHAKNYLPTGAGKAFMPRAQEMVNPLSYPVGTGKRVWSTAPIVGDYMDSAKRSFTGQRPRGPTPAYSKNRSTDPTWSDIDREQGVYAKHGPQVRAPGVLAPLGNFIQAGFGGISSGIGELGAKTVGSVGAATDAMGLTSGLGAGADAAGKYFGQGRRRAAHTISSPRKSTAFGDWWNNDVGNKIENAEPGLHRSVSRGVHAAGNEIPQWAPMYLGAKGGKPAGQAAKWALPLFGGEIGSQMSDTLAPRGTPVEQMRESMSPGERQHAQQRTMNVANEQLASNPSTATKDDQRVIDEATQTVEDDMMSGEFLPQGGAAQQPAPAQPPQQPPLTPPGQQPQIQGSGAATLRSGGPPAGQQPTLPPTAPQQPQPQQQPPQRPIGPAGPMGPQGDAGPVGTPEPPAGPPEPQPPVGAQIGTDQPMEQGQQFDLSTDQPALAEGMSNGQIDITTGMRHVDQIVQSGRDSIAQSMVEYGDAPGMEQALGMLDAQMRAGEEPPAAVTSAAVKKIAEESGGDPNDPQWYDQIVDYWQSLDTEQQWALGLGIGAMLLGVINEVAGGNSLFSILLGAGGAAGAAYGSGALDDVLGIDRGAKPEQGPIKADPSTLSTPVAGLQSPEKGFDAGQDMGDTMPPNIEPKPLELDPMAPAPESPLQPMTQPPQQQQSAPTPQGMAPETASGARDAAKAEFARISGAPTTSWVNTYGDAGGKPGVFDHADDVKSLVTAWASKPGMDPQVRNLLASMSGPVKAQVVKGLNTKETRDLFNTGINNPFTGKQVVQLGPGEERRRAMLKMIQAG